ncbi:ubiquinol oxidase subunit II [Mangrovibacterium lignilyticum]|uniref:ubiquinol oxidase subunit II n=1 Tax=Mangrovibacterium lignilyticum TaxID=2668052 RepID=UPI0013D0104F|nr:ubiquinol oxidase subunit II [Mangrovibacterium lignilyticum]
MSSSVKKKGIKFLKGTLLVLMAIFAGGCKKMVVLESKGAVGVEQAFLIKIAFLLMLIVVLPVFVMVIWFSIRYRASNTKATFKPKWTHSNAVEAVVWGVPVAIIIVLGYITWESTHELNPYKPLESDNKAIEIDVISTDSDWLFVYPEYGVAIVNQMVFPVNTPLNFRLTSGSVMTSFFIPALGSQMYAMAGMQTKLHLMANEVGVFRGHNMEYSGNGYAGMNFNAISTTQEGFENWLKGVKESTDSLSVDRFKDINSMFNMNHPVTSFSAVEPDLFNKVVMENMHWMGMPEHSEMEEKYGDEPKGSMHMMHGHGSMH